MSLHQNAALTIAYKAYAAGTIDATLNPDPAVLPGNSGAQYLRRVGSTVGFAKDAYQSNEMSPTRQVVDLRLGTRRVQGDVSGELSPGTYKDFMEAVLRGTWDTTVALTQATSAMSSATITIAANTPPATPSTITASAGSWIASGLKLGDNIRLGSGFGVGNLGRNLRIIGITATILTVAETLVAEGPIATWAASRIGKKVFVPSSGHVSRLFALEHNYSDSSVPFSQVFTECRAGKIAVHCPASGLATIDVGFTGRNMWPYSAGAAPFFQTVAPATTTPILASASGTLRVAGAGQAVITGMDFTIDLSPSATPVVGSNLVPDIFLGTTKVSGTMTAFFSDDMTLYNAFLAESHVSAMIRLETDATGSGNFLSFMFPKLTFTGADIQRSGEGGLPINLPFTATISDVAVGADSSVVIIQDSTI